MRVLYVNNYCASKEAVLNCKKNNFSLAHTWGISSLLSDKNIDLEFADSSYVLKEKNRILRIFCTLIFQLKLVKKYLNYDVIYSAAAHCIDLFSVLKRLGIFKGKLICVIHHPGNIVCAKYYYKIVCFSLFTKKLIEEKYRLDNVIFQYWGPYFPFYEANLPNTFESKYDFYSNGKSFRDFSLLSTAFNTTKNTLALLTNNKHVNRFNSNVKIIQFTSQEDNINYLFQSKVMIVPIVKNHKGVCGVTSINDALALNKPLLISDSCNLGFSAEAAGIGLTYRGGDLEDLKKKMKLILTPEIYDSIKKTMTYFANNNEYSKFENLIHNLITGEPL